MQLWKNDLAVTADYIAANKVTKVFDDNDFIGFYAVIKISDTTCEIDHLWLLPEKINQGYGKLIFAHLLQELKNEGYEKATLVAEPNAVYFYNKMNGKVTAQVESKPKGRFLDVYSFDL